MSDQNDHNGGLVAALRSVWFYYVACTPCRKIGHRRETRKEAEREKTIKARLEMEQPGLYRHPDPENTNQYWMEDINMGPSLPKRGASRNTSQRKLKSSGTEGATTDPGTDRSVEPTSPIIDRATSIGSSTHFHSAETAGSPTVVNDDLEARTTLSMSVTDSQDLDWNRKRYEREDEELWGHHVYNRAGQRLREVITKGRDTAGRLFDAGRPPRDQREVTEEDRYQFYTAPRNPPVNDYHPPVVSSRPASKHEYRWMLQPPPPAKVMEGKVPVSRSGSQISVNSRASRASRASKASRRTNGGSLASKEDFGLGRLVGEKIVQDKIRKGEKPNLNESAEASVMAHRPSTRRSRTTSTMSSMPSQRSARSRSNTTGSESSDTIYERRQRRRVAKQKKAAVAGTGSEADDETDDERPGSAATERHAAMRPKLQTIASSDLSSKKSEISENLNISNLATMSEPARSPGPISPALGDVTNYSSAPNTTAVSRVQTPDKERPAGASLDSGLALS